MQTQKTKELKVLACNNSKFEPGPYFITIQDMQLNAYIFSRWI